VAAKPQVSVIKSGGKYVLEPETIDKRELEARIVLKKETNTRYRVINITDSQRKIIEILLEEGSDKSANLSVSEMIRLITGG
jgi:hypothetical protein